jgi:hypothetical protein
MPLKRSKYRKIGSGAKHKWAILRNMVTSLIMHERIQTTVPKAKELKILGDRIIKYGKQGMYLAGIDEDRNHGWVVFRPLPRVISCFCVMNVSRNDCCSSKG